MVWLIRAILTLTFITTAALGGYVIAKDPKTRPTVFTVCLCWPLWVGCLSD